LLQEYGKVWATYYEGRRLKPFYERLLTQAIQAYKWRAIDTKKFDTLLQDALKFGFVQSQVDIIKAMADIEIAHQIVAENTPTLAMITEMGEFIDVNKEFIDNVLYYRRIDKEYADVFAKYYSGRTVVKAVDRLVNAIRLFYEHFAVPEDLLNELLKVMAEGGWNSRQIAVFKKELEIVNRYRIATQLMPNAREFINYGVYVEDTKGWIDFLFQERGIVSKELNNIIEKWKQFILLQIEGRKIMRFFWFYIDNMKYAYGKGLLTKQQVKQYLEQWKAYGVDSTLIDLIMQGMDFYLLYKMGEYY